MSLGYSIVYLTNCNTALCLFSFAINCCTSALQQQPNVLLIQKPAMELQMFLDPFQLFSDGHFTLIVAVNFSAICFCTESGMAQFYA